MDRINIQMFGVETKPKQNYRIYLTTTREEVFELQARSPEEALALVRATSSLYLTEATTICRETKIVEWEDETNVPG